MTTRLDLAIQKHPSHDADIRLLASRDPSGNLKYLDWGAKMLASGQALAPELADILDLFHKFNGQSLGDGGRALRGHMRGAPLRDFVRSDIYSYQPKDLAALRTLLLKLQRAQDRKRKKREELYRIKGDMETTVIYDGLDLVVRHIKNKAASIHYGLGTKWCTSMKREGYFEDYELNNATFFFFERKEPKNDEFDKVALVIPRAGHHDFTMAFTSVDEQVDMMSLARVYGSHVFNIYRTALEHSNRYPGSVMFRVYHGTATLEELEATFALVASDGLENVYEAQSVLESICCNDAASESLLLKIAECGIQKQQKRRKRFRHRLRLDPGEFIHSVWAAIVIHPAVSSEVRERFTKELRRRRIKIEDIRRVDGRGYVSVLYRTVDRRRRTYMLRNPPLGELRWRLGVHERRVASFKKKIKKKVAEEARKKRRAAKR